MNLKGFFCNVFRDMDTNDGIIIDRNSNDELYYRFLKQMSIVHQAFGPMHRSDLEEFFASAVISRDNMLSLLHSHCYKMQKEFSNVFLILMYAYSFAFSLIEFFRIRTGRGYYFKVSKFMEFVFIYEITQRFYAGGGWNELRKFCTGQKLLEVLDFINVCYSEKGKLLTFVEAMSVTTEDQNGGKCTKKYIDFGIHSERTLNLLKNNLKFVERSVFITHAKEISRYPYFTRMLIISFLKMNFALDNIAWDLNPSDEVKSILISPLLDFFEEYLKI